MKAQRHYKIREILHERAIGTQEELIAALQESGYPVTQATISRDIKELQLSKTPMDDGGYKYTLPSEQRYNPVVRLKRALNDHFVHIDYTSHLVVMKCLPGTAGTLGALIDNMEWEDIMGTICGDDTILIICRSVDNSKAIVEQIMAMLSKQA